MSLTLLIISFIAGLLTVLAPCSLPLLPVIIGGSIRNSESRLAKFSPYIIVGSLAVSIVIFTLLIRVSTIFIDVSDDFWKVVSGAILVLLSVTMIFPIWWATVMSKLGTDHAANKWLAGANKKEGITKDILIGLALGPVFSSCSPTYFIILAAVLPQSFINGLILLVVYALGLSIILLAIALLGQKLVQKLNWAANPTGWFKKIIGILILIVGILIITGAEARIEAHLIDQGFNFIELEESLLDRADFDTTVELEI